ncbi:MAG TPA: hypothetical protein VK612_05365, partial [Pyrinomonadaceae bacterium]|nr:hypothetical protein [Pyrinomonadaceae bacterium]
MPQLGAKAMARSTNKKQIAEFLVMCLISFPFFRIVGNPKNTKQFSYCPSHMDRKVRSFHPT